MRKEVLNGLARELAWLRESGVQISGGPDDGGVYAWLDESGPGAPAPGFIYSEITGYFMTLCAQLAALGDPSWIARGERAARWIVERAMTDDGAVLSRKYADPARAAADPYSFERGRVAFFDCAMVGFGLLQMHAATGERRWRDAAERIHAFATRDLFGPDGALRHALYDHPARAALAPEDRWSAHVGPFEAKGALFLDALAEATGAATPARQRDTLLEMACAAQDASGRFPTTPDGRVTHLHPHSYTIEALLYIGARRARPDLLDRARRAVAWSFEGCLLRSEPVQQWSEDPARIIPGLRSDVVAQSLRALTLVRSIDPGAALPWRNPEDEARAHGLFDRLAAFTLPSGGTAYGRDEYGEKNAHANTWCHFFAVEAKIQRALLGAGERSTSPLIT